MTDLAKTPERIYGWLDTQLSIARHYGGLSYNEKHYVIAHNEEGTPLVRSDVLADEQKAKRKAAKETSKQPANADLFDDKATNETP